MEHSYWTRKKSRDRMVTREFDTNMKAAINDFFMENRLLPPYKMPNCMDRIDVILDDPMSIAPENTKHLSEEDLLEFRALFKFKETRKERLMPYSPEKLRIVSEIAAGLASEVSGEQKKKKKRRGNNNNKAKAAKGFDAVDGENDDILIEKPNGGGVNDGGGGEANDNGRAFAEMMAMNEEAEEARRQLFFKGPEVDLHDRLDELFFTYDTRASELDPELAKPIVDRLKTFVFQNDAKLSQKLEATQASLIERSGDSRQEFMSGLEMEYDARCPLCTEAFNMTTKVPMQSQCGPTDALCIMCSACWVDACASVKRCLCARDFNGKRWTVDGAWVGARFLGSAAC